MSSRAGELAGIQPGSRVEPRPFTDGREHLLAELEWLRLALHREVLRLRVSHLPVEDQFRGLYVSDAQVDAILQVRNKEISGRAGSDEPPVRIESLNLQILEVHAEIVARTMASQAAGIALPLVRLSRLFDLSEFECKVLVVCAAVEVDLDFESLYSYAQNDVTRKHPSVDLVLRLLCQEREHRLELRPAFGPDSPLFHQSLVVFAEEKAPGSFLARLLKADERIVSFLLDQPAIDSRLRKFTTLSKPARPPSPLHLPKPVQQDLGNAVRTAGTDSQVFFFDGPRGAGKRSAAEALCAEAGRSLLTLDLNAAAASDVPLALVLSLLQREAILHGADMFFAHAETLQGETLQQQRLLLERFRPPSGLRVFISSESPWQHRGSVRMGPWLEFHFPVPAYEDRIALWREALVEAPCPLDAGINPPALANKFALTAGEIHRSCRAAFARTSFRGEGTLTLENLESAARSQSNHELRRLAQKVTAVQGWESLVLPPHAMRQLQDVQAAAKHRYLVYAEWGFEQQTSLGKGINVLFHGASGTGKTLAAGVLARELALDLYKIDLSLIVSKYIGETEKQLNQVFREARSSNAILFFDEADALLGKRSEVKDAHDRYANVEVAYLLQKMEEYEGIVILATNFRKNMDDAFTRRMHHIVEFPFPDAEYRERIFRSVIPAKAPLAADVNLVFLARQFELAGGNIRNVAVAAAFLAAEEGSPIRMEHFLVATARELQKMGKLPSRSDFREYYEVIRSRA